MISNIQEYINTPLLYNHWYVAGTVEEFGREPVAKTLLERSIVFYRTEAGDLTALQNRCLHRSYPLSESEVVGDNLVCNYHGACYEPSGTLVRIPSQAQAPVPKRALKKYPLQERGPFVFIWMGDGEPDEARLPAMSNLGNPDYKLLHGHFELAGSYLFMCENLYDLTHFVYLHKKTFGFDDSFFDTPAFTIERDDGLIGYRNLELDVDQILGPLPPDAQQELAGQSCTRPDDTVAFAPGIVQSHFRVLLDGQEEATDANIQGFVQHFMTPVTKSSCLYWWGYSINRGLDMPEEFHAGMRGFLEMGYTEDVVAVQKMQELLENDTTPFEEMNIAGDKAGKLFRRVILKWAAEEYGVDTSELSQPDVLAER